MAANRALTTKSRTAHLWVGSAIFSSFFLVAPKEAVASGGGPIIVLFCISTWVLGFVPFFAIEALIYWRTTGFPMRRAALDALLVNAISSVMVFAFAPIAISVVGLVSAPLAGQGSSVALAFTTWVFDSPEHFNLAIVMTFCWYLALCVICVLIESWMFSHLWTNRNEEAPVSSLRVSILCNLPVAVVSLIGGGLIWRDLFLS